MVEKRDFPKQMSAHWGCTTVDAYVALLLTRRQEVEEIHLTLVEQITAVQTASLAPDVPRWFADGLGLWVAEKVYPHDEAIEQWDDQAREAAQSMQQPDDFIKNKLRPDQAARVGYLFIKELKSKPSQFKRLISAMRKGQSFQDAFRRAYGVTPEELIKRMASTQ